MVSGALFFTLIGFSASSHAGLFDDMGNMFNDMVEDIGGELVEQGKNVGHELKNIGEDVKSMGEDAWGEVSGFFGDTVKRIAFGLGDASIDAVKDVSEDLFDAMKNVKSTFAGINIPLEDIGRQTTADLTYTIPLGAADLEFGIRGAVDRTLSEGGEDFVGINGKLFVRLKTVAGLGYTPMVWVELTYINPVIKFEDGAITGLLVLQPNGSVYFTGVALPLQFSASLAQAMKLPGLKKITALKKVSESIAFDADVGTVALSFPLTNQTDTRFNFILEISAGVDAIAKISSNWRVKILERVSWSRTITLDIPPIKLPLASVPSGLIGKLNADEGSQPEASYAQPIVSYSFDDSGSDIVEDKSGYGNNARLHGGAKFKDGAVHLDGKDDYIDLPDDLLGTLDAITVYSEVYIDENQATPYFIYGLGNTKGEWGDGYLFTTGDNYRTTLSGCHWVCEQATAGDNFRVPRGSWQQLVYTLKDNVATLYLNGVVVEQNTDMTLKPSDIGDGRTNANYIGRSLYATDKYFSGAIRNFQIWDGALTHNEIISQFSGRPAAKVNAQPGTPAVTRSDEQVDIVVNARGVVGDEKLSLIVGGVTLETWTLSKSMRDYAVNTSYRGDIRVAFINDGGNRDVQVDFIQVDGEIRQAEQQSDNTGAWGNGRCGGMEKSDWLNCNGSIGFGEVAAGG